MPIDVERVLDLDPKQFNLTDYTLSVVGLEGQIADSTVPLQADISEHYGNTLDWEDGDGIYIESQIDQYMAGHPDLDAYLRDETKDPLIRLSNVANYIVRAGTGNHGVGSTIIRDDAGESRRIRVRDTFNIDNPPKTKCNVFNDTYVRVFETLANTRGFEEINKQYKFISTSTYFAQDIERYTTKRGSLAHGYLILVSQDSRNSLRLTPFDPYFTEPGHTDELDRKIYRSVDAIIGFYKEMGCRMDPGYAFFEYDADVIKALLENIHMESGVDKVSLASLYGVVLKRLQNSKPSHFDDASSMRTIERILEEIRSTEEYAVSMGREEQNAEYIGKRREEVQRKFSQYEKDKFSADKYNSLLEKGRKVLPIAIEQLFDDALTNLEGIFDDPENEEKSLLLVHMYSALDDMASWDIPIDPEIWERFTIIIDKLSWELRTNKARAELYRNDPFYGILAYRAQNDILEGSNYDINGYDFDNFAEYKSSFLTLISRLFGESWIYRLPDSKGMTERQRIILEKTVNKFKAMGSDFDHEVLELEGRLKN